MKLRFSDKVDAIKFSPVDFYYKGYEYLHAGDYVNGFRCFEWRWHPENIATLPDPFVKYTSTPVWRGEPLTGKSVLVQMEMGYGDCIQFYRFLPILKILGAKNIVVLQTASLHHLLAQMPCIDYITNNENEGPSLTCDYWIGSMSLAHIALTSPTYIKYLFPISKSKIVGSEGYFHATPSSIQPKIGVNWGASRGYLHSTKSINVEHMLKLCGENCYSLNPEDDGPFHPIPDIEWKTNWAKTASHMKAMAAVVTVDTGTAHLAGALGVKCILLLPEDKHVCWRWKNGIWYDSITKIRQTEWNTVPNILKGILKNE